MNLPRLKKLHLNENEITMNESFDGHANLEFIDISKNKLKTFEGFRNLPKLKELYINENEISSLLELGNLEKLTKLHMHHN
jgi:Leucine-rich repeat (LRR) protein